MKYLIVIFFLFFITQTKAQESKIKFELHNIHGFSDFYGTTENYNKSYAYRYGISSNCFFNKSNSIGIGFSNIRNSIYYTQIFYTDSAHLIPATVKSYSYYNYLDIPISFYHYFYYDKKISPFFKVGLSNLFLYKLVTEMKDVPETINGSPSDIYSSVHPTVTSGFNEIKNETLLRIYNVSINMDIGLRFKIYNQINLKTSLNFSGNLLTNWTQKISIGKNKMYFVGVNFSVEI